MNSLDFADLVDRAKKHKKAAKADGNHIELSEALLDAIDRAGYKLVKL